MNPRANCEMYRQTSAKPDHGFGNNPKFKLRRAIAVLDSPCISSTFLWPIRCILQDLNAGLQGNVGPRIRLLTAADVSLESTARGLVQAAPRKVLFIVDQFCEMGGAERVLLNMIRFLPRDRFEPRLVTFKIDASLAVFQNFPCPLHVFPLTRTWDWNAAKVGLRLNRLIREEKIDVVHTFFETSDIWGGAIARLSGCRVLISSRRDMGILRSAKHRVAYRLINPLFDEIQTVSKQVREFCIERDRVRPAKVVTLYSGVSVDRIPVASGANLPLENDASHVVTTVAHIRKVKGVDNFLRAAAKVRDHFPRAMFLVVGDNHQPEHYRELVQLRARLGLENRVHFAGAVEDIFSVLNASDVFCLLSRSEGLSNAMLEAMACGLPCVATRVGGNPELIEDGYNGFLTDNEDVDAAALAIRTLLRDPALATRMGARNRTRVEREFTNGAMIRNLVESYERLLDEHAA